jgi:hypothetical protein
MAPLSQELEPPTNPGRFTAILAHGGETMRGYIYVLTNPNMPGLVKIGYTQRLPRERANELSRATGVPSI